MDKKYLKENNLLEAHKEFMRLCEYISAMPLVEDDEEEDVPQEGGDMPNMNGNEMMGNATDANNVDNNMAADNNMELPTDNAMPNGNENPMGGNQDMGFDMPNMDMMDNGMADGEDEQVIDVEDITNAQEKMNSKVNSVGRNLNQVDDRITKLLDTIDKMEQMINANNEEIKAFKQEFEKRNPTPTEKLNLRSLDSYPFNVNPKDYWAEKGISNPYQAYADNQESTTKEYEITNDDVDNFDERKVANSFFIDDELRQTLGKIFDL